LIYSSITSAWPSSADYVKNVWLAPIQTWANTGTNIPFNNFNDYLHFFTGSGGGGNPGGGGGGPGTGPQRPGIVSTCDSGVSISYDDGPYVWNREVVDLYNSRGAKTTFFVNGNNWDCIYNQDRVNDLRYAYEQGHTIGSHTWFHTDITTISNAQLGTELDRIETALFKILGIKPGLFRPPYGSINQEKLDYLNSRGYTVVTWDVDTGDANGASVSQSMDEIRNGATDHSMILSHETYQSSAEQLAPQAISYLQGRGFTLKSIDQCLNVTPYQQTGGGYGTRDGSWVC
jgi:peptidoglycan/xylan/chitin deacetylase (PgdA/CDA1 family)